MTFQNLGPDPTNPTTHVLIKVSGVTYSVFAGTEQASADQIAETRNLQ